jgi:hypothetical protein
VLGCLATSVAGTLPPPPGPERTPFEAVEESPLPFTLSHPAAVLPLRAVAGERLCWLALALGSVAPDLPYFVDFQASREHTHSVSGIFTFALPAGWVLVLLFRHALRPALLDLAPPALAARVPLRPRTPGAAAVGLSLVLGAATHVLWDAITHGELIRVLPAGELRDALLRAYLLPHRALQHGSTLAGGVALASAFAAWWRRSPPAFAHSALLSPRERASLQAALAGVPVALGAAYALTHHPWILASWAILVMVNLGVVFALSSAMLFVLSYTAWWQWRARAKA